MSDGDQREQLLTIRYLGSIVEVIGEQRADVHPRVTLTTVRFGQMRHVTCVESQIPTPQTAIQTAHCRCIFSPHLRVGSLTHDRRHSGHIKWDKQQNSRCDHWKVSLIPRGINPPSIWSLRLQWANYILCMDPERLLAKAVRHTCNYMTIESRTTFCQVYDAPGTISCKELHTWVTDRSKWRVRVHDLPFNSHTKLHLNQYILPLWSNKNLSSQSHNTRSHRTLTLCTMVIQWNDFRS